MATARYTSRDGDMVDAICKKHYGNEFTTTAVVYEANRGLADYGPVLPAGVVILLPEINEPRRVATLRLWD